MLGFDSMQIRVKMVILFFITSLIFAIPSIDGKQTGIHNQANQGCTCHYSVNAITATHTFPVEYNPGQSYSISINLNNGGQSFNGGFNVMVDKGQLANAGTYVKINSAGDSATHDGTQNLGWTFDWVAPAPGSGATTVHVAVLQSDASGTNSGDTWDSLTHTINEFAPPNDPPVAYDLNLTPSPTAPTNSDLTLTYQYGDPNNDPESGTLVHWFIDGNRATAYDGDTTIPASSTSPGQKWKAEITPSDGSDFGGTETTNEVTIVDVDSDNDGVFDSEDAFPNDPNETTDSDNDGVGDNSDDFPNDPNETVDSDSDGVGDNSDEFPNDPNETADSDNDGVGDNADEFPFDPLETTDTDSDGVGDNSDAFPNDPTETLDSDFDGVGNNADAFPFDGSETADSDSDGVGDNADAFPTDPNETQDSDSDGVGDNSDVFPDDANETLDTDMDGVGDNADAFPSDANETLDSDMDGVGDNADAFPTDANETLDSDMDGVGDNSDAFPNNSMESADSDMDGIGDNADAFPMDASETVDSDQDGVGDNSDAFPMDSTETMDTDEDGVGDNADAFPNDPTETLDSDGDGIGDNAQALAEAEKEEEDDSSMLTYIIAGIALIIVGIVGFLVVIRSKDDDSIGAPSNKDYSQEMSSFSGNPFQNYAGDATQITPEPAQTYVAPVIAEATVVQQWTDESGHTWRQMSDNTVEWWNGTDWQRT